MLLSERIERLFLYIKRFRRIFTRYDKLDIMFVPFILLALIMDAFSCQHNLFEYIFFVDKEKHVSRKIYCKILPYFNLEF